MTNAQYRLPDEQSTTAAATVCAVPVTMTVNHLITNPPIQNDNTNNNTNQIQYNNNTNQIQYNNNTNQIQYNNNTNQIQYNNKVDQNPLNNNNGQDLPCEKYRQFLDSSVEQRTFMIGKLVETFANTIDSIWHPKFLIDKQPVKVMPTRGFCSEIFKRSKATYSTLQISLFYIYRVKRAVHEKLYQRAQLNKDMQTSNKQEDLMCCGRRMFLASLMVASKYLHDKNYHNKAWAKITGLDIKEINAAEMAFLNLIDYQLYISKSTFDIWYTRIHGYIEDSYKSSPPQPNNAKSTINNNATITSSSSPSITQDSVQNIIKDQPSLTSGNGTRTIQLNNCNYPSPPPDPSAQSPTADKNFQRNDSGVSFDIMSPPIVGTKRHLISEESINKRTCH